MSTYLGLKNDIASYMARSDLSSSLATFVALAESRIRRDVRVTDMQTTTTLTTTSGAAALPTGFIEPISIYLNEVNWRWLSYQPPATFYRSAFDDTGSPTFYTIDGGQFVFAPTPVDGTEAVLSYYGAYSALSNDADTNWLLDTHYGVYLYASLAEAKAFVEDDEGAMKWLNAYQELVKSINREAQRDVGGAGPLYITSCSGP